MTDERGLFGISVAAELADTGVQNLRVYERHGLVEPARTEGGTRRYSEADVERLVRIRDLLDDGLNLAGVSRVLRLEAEITLLRAQLERRARR
jgi:MerR family transcriptional regulator/heat shock protein HspR